MDGESVRASSQFESNAIRSAAYSIETTDATEGSPATYTIYGRINMPPDTPDIVYSLSEDQETPVQVEVSKKP